MLTELHAAADESDIDKELLRKARGGESLTKEETARMRSITERRKLAQHESRARGADSGAPGAVRAEAAGGGGAAGRPAASLNKIRVPDKATAKEELEIEKLMALTRAYFGLVQKQVVDLVPKYIQLLLVEEPKDMILKAIGAMTDAQVADLMAPSEDVQAKRAETISALAKLQEAEAMLFEVAQMSNLGLKL